MTTFVLRAPEHAHKLIAFLKENAGEQARIGQPLVVSIEAYAVKRSVEQNRKLHAILNEIAENVYIDGRRYDVEAWKEQVRRRFIGTEELDLPNGTRIERGVSTTTLNASQFSELIERVSAWAATELLVEV
jgi:hypothetical protein